MDISLLYQSIQSSTLNTLTPSAIDSVRVQLRHNCTVLEMLPLHSHPRPFYVDITAKAPGYMDVLAFYSFFEKKSNFKVSKKSHFPSSAPSSLYACRCARVDHQKVTYLQLTLTARFDRNSGN